MKVYIVTYCSPYAEYNNQISIRKAFTSESAAKQYIEKEKEYDIKQAGNNWIGNYDIEEIELEDGE
ncbi:DUF7336 domain-containing protein [Paenibacillus naphthalenovorans]|uniref:DUF7336 domain-containing protein n=1 Tax=Paenibacillus naphthalenovorans TaxID=162209 RepID=A0A0U2UGB1_9BACL|nr:hypothetical protein [Paenibacillus naphthalenovorans]ALS22220.1 hypothetical protein IJ22_18460 [Paenibacillus naphthalenovorans]